MTQVPKTLMRRDQAFHAPTAIAIGHDRTAREHGFKKFKQFVCDLEIGLVAGVMERDQYFVGKSSAVSWRGSGAPGLPCGISDLLMQIA